MCLSSLKQFIDNKQPGYTANAYVSFPGFEYLYVRHGFHNVDDNIKQTLDLANMVY